MAIRTLVVVSDLHCGCQMGLCPARGVTLDGGGRYEPSRLQRIVWGWWCEFWRRWVPEVTHGEPYAVVVNGDALDGRHHGSTTQISQNLADQRRIAYEVLAPVRELAAAYYHVRGTEAHVGQSGEDEEELAGKLAAEMTEDGRRARWELWARLGSGGPLVHFSHHIGTAGSTAYESSAVMREMSESFVEAGRWREQPPDVIVRSHRHRLIRIEVPSTEGSAIGIVTPAWQLKTPFCHKVAGARQSQPQIGGIIVRDYDGAAYTRHFVKHITRPKESVL